VAGVAPMQTMATSNPMVIIFAIFLAFQLIGCERILPKTSPLQ
jgi:hypothetical protein